MPTEHALGDCYEAAGRFVMRRGNRASSTLVHGVVSGLGPLLGQRIGHAWVECGDDVIDRSNGGDMQWPKQDYYRLGQIIPSECRYYLGHEACAQMLEHEHFGPWEGVVDV